MPRTQYNNKGNKGNVSLILDSGAFSAWTKGVEINIDEYASFCLEHIDTIDYAVNLDVIPGRPYQTVTKKQRDDAAEKGWQNYKYLLSRGIPKHKLIHVFHQGEDLKWLVKIAKNVSYIGLSPANDKTTNQKIIWLDSCMQHVTDSSGMPIVKFHGFAVTSFRLLTKYPWYSVDSTAWVMMSAYGGILFPSLKNNKWVFDADCWRLAISTRSKKKESNKHIDTLSPDINKIVKKRIAELGFKIGKSEFDDDGKEIVIDEGLSNSHVLRDEWNIKFFFEFEKSFPKWPWAYKQKLNEII